MSYRKKLIEVSLPLEAINAESAREKSIRHGHPSTLHLWWARRPLAACRAVLWSSLVDDPSEYMPDEESANRERERLFAILEKLVKWENINNEEVLDAAKLEIARSVARDLGCDVPVGKEAVREFLATKAPLVLDPFAGGGSIPLEAQRLGLRAYASDLNPVAVLINKALIEIPPKFAGMPPVHPPEAGEKQATFFKKEWKGAEGLAEDVRYYGKWMRDEAEKRIGHLYPKVKITAEMLEEREDLRKQGLKAGDELTVIAWLWARTVKCPNPACGCQMPLVRSFALSTNTNKKAWVSVDISDNRIGEDRVQFSVKIGNGTPSEGTVNRNGAKCVICEIPVPFTHIRSEGQAGKINARLMAIVADGPRGRIYLNPIHEHEIISSEAKPEWHPDGEIPKKHRNFQTPNYGMNTLGDLFTPRQLVALDTLSGLIEVVREKIRSDLIKSSQGINEKTVEAYLLAISVYLAFAIDKGANYWSSLCAWHSSRDNVMSTFARQALPMVWDYTEANPFSDSTGNFLLGIEQSARMLENAPATVNGMVQQADAMKTIMGKDNIVVSTDPPYYDNIDYADLSDFFYVWLRRSLGNLLPDLFATMLVPKKTELVAMPHRFNGDKKKAEKFFEEGLHTVFNGLVSAISVSIPMTVFYAFKQTEAETHHINSTALDTTRDTAYGASTGWETMLSSLLSSGYQLTGTWPMRTELVTSLKKGFNALATSIVLVCRIRSKEASTISRRELLSIIKNELPVALRQLQMGNIAPVDFAQAAIGPGMAIFSQYQAVLEADGTVMDVRTALLLINQALDEYLAEQEGEYDSDTRWALAWFEQYGHEPGPYGAAETLSKAKNTSVEGLAHAGFLEARSGKVRLYRRDELDETWDPAKDKRLTAWEAAQHLIRALDKEGEKGAGALLGRLGALGETARDLAYRLYTICERKGWAQEALAYNMLVVAWPRIKEQAQKGVKQEKLM